MFETLTIRNFRCFGHLTVTPLRRLNLIAGMNNVGKTALLEAVFLHMGPTNPLLTLSIDAFRGIEQKRYDPDSLWGWLFNTSGADEPIVLSTVDTDQVSRRLTIRLAEPLESDVVVGENGAADIAPHVSDARSVFPLPKDLVYEYEDSSGQRAVTRSSISVEGSGQRLSASASRLRAMPKGIFLSTRTRFSIEDAERFSVLERDGRQHELLVPLQLLEPKLQRLAVLVTGRTPLIAGDVGLGRMVPLPYMGDGMVRLTSMILSIIDVRGGVALIDELENGIHHSVLRRVWSAIALAARQSDVQVFATTHSWECIAAAHRAVKDGDTYDLALHRLERLGEQIRAFTSDEETLETAIRAELEIR